MDPVSIQASSLNAIRPTIALQADLSAVLREGRVLSGEVLQSFGGGSLLIGIGSHRVPAKSQVELQAGQRFMFEVEGQGDELTLRVLADDLPAEPSLLRALRGVLGHDEPLGRLLQTLAAKLVALGAGEGLTNVLGSHLVAPERGASEFAAQLRALGLAFESRLALPAALHLPAAEASALAADVLRGIAESLLSGAKGTPGAPELPVAATLLERLGAEIARLLGAGEGAPARELAFANWLHGLQFGGGERPVPELPQLLATALQSLFEGSTRERLLTHLRGSGVGLLGPGLEVLLVRKLLGLGATPRQLLAAQAQLFAEVGRMDLKGRLLADLAGTAPGPAREVLANALAGLEAEQLLNLARKGAGEALHWSVPIADQGRWTTAHVFVEPRSSRAGQADSTAAWRVSLALDLSRTGPLRADLLARPGDLVVSVHATRADVVTALESGLAELTQRLALGGRRVQISVHRAAPESVSVEATATDVRFLREHHVMDLSA